MSTAADGGVVIYEFAWSLGSNENEVIWRTYETQTRRSVLFLEMIVSLLISMTLILW